MPDFAEPLARLIQEFKRLPGIGQKSAQRLAFHVLRASQEDAERLQSLEPSTSALVFLVHDLVSHILGGQPEEGDRSFLRLVLRSLMDEGEFARLGLQGGPSHWVQKIEECVEAAKAAGDMVDGPVPTSLGGWCTHHLISGFMMHFLPVDPVIDYGIPREELVNQVIWFCLRGMGMKEKAIRRYYEPKGICTV